jgi:hypothetical protein
MDVMDVVDGECGGVDVVVSEWAEWGGRDGDVIGSPECSIRLRLNDGSVVNALLRKEGDRGAVESATTHYKYRGGQTATEGGEYGQGLFSLWGNVPGPDLEAWPLEMPCNTTPLLSWTLEKVQSLNKSWGSAIIHYQRRYHSYSYHRPYSGLMLELSDGESERGRKTRSHSFLKAATGLRLGLGTVPARQRKPCYCYVVDA